MNVTNNVIISDNGRWNQNSIDASTNNFQPREIISALDQLVRDNFVTGNVAAVSKCANMSRSICWPVVPSITCRSVS
jgi:hypothetical protein